MTLSYDKAVQILHDTKDELHDILEGALKSSDMKGLHAECLTDIWIGKDRFAFVDLSAGPFAWALLLVGMVFVQNIVYQMWQRLLRLLQKLQKKRLKKNCKTQSERDFPLLARFAIKGGELLMLLIQIPFVLRLPLEREELHERLER